MRVQKKALSGKRVHSNNNSYASNYNINKELLINDAEKALSYINADDRDIWYKSGIALKSEYGDSAFVVWDSWSRTSDAYKQSDSKAVWKSLPYAGKVTIGTLIYWAKESGWDEKDAHYKQVSVEETRQREKKRKTRELEQQKVDLAQAQLAQEEAERLRSLSKSIDYYPPHLYVERKQITPYSARALDDILLIPMVDIHKQLRSLQRIGWDCKKRYLFGTKKKGLFCPIGNVFSAEYIAIVEGYATGCTVHDITGLPVVVAFDSGNLMSVVEAFYNKYPEKLMTIYADNDRETEQKIGKNTGILAAEKVCDRFRGVGFLTPEFPDDAPLELSDFNDAVCWAEGVFYEG